MVAGPNGSCFSWRFVCYLGGRDFVVGLLAGIFFGLLSTARTLASHGTCMNCNEGNKGQYKSESLMRSAMLERILEWLALRPFCVLCICFKRGRSLSPLGLGSKNLVANLDPIVWHTCDSFPCSRSKTSIRVFDFVSLREES